MLGWVIVLVLAFVTLHGEYLPLGPPGIDPGWQWAVNEAGSADWVFGRDVVFTYGPLAFLVVPMDASSNLLLANLFLLAMQIAFAAALFALFRRDPDPLAFAMTAGLYVIADHLGLTIEAWLLIVVALLALWAIRADRLLPMAAAAGVSALLVFTKLTLGLGSLVILAAVAITAGSAGST